MVAHKKGVFLCFLIFIIQLLINNILIQLPYARIQYLGASNLQINDLVVYQDLNHKHKTYAYAAQGTSISVIDVSNPTDVELLERLHPKPDLVSDLYISNNMLIAAHGAAGIDFYSLESPKHPTYLYNIPQQSHEVWVGDNTLVTLNRMPGGSGGGSNRQILIQKMIDITDIENPRVIRERILRGYSAGLIPHYSMLLKPSTQNVTQDEFIYYDPTGIYRETRQGVSLLLGDYKISYPLGLFLHQNLVYLTLTDSIEIFDIGQATLLQTIPFASTITGPSIRDGGMMYVQTEEAMLVYNIHDSITPQLIRTFQSPFEIKTIVDGVAYGALKEKGLGIIDLAIRDNLIPTFHFQGHFRVDRIASSNGLFLTKSFCRDDSPWSYHLLRYTEDGQISFKRRLDVEKPNNIGIGVIDHNVAAVSTEYGLQIFDISDPANPKRASILPHLHHKFYSDTSKGLFVSLYQGFLHINEWNFEGKEKAWYIYSLADPYHPELVEKLPHDDNIRSFRGIFHENQYYFIQEDESLGIIDFSSPINPQSTGAVDLHNFAIRNIRQISVDQNHIAFLVDTSNGIESAVDVLDIHDIEHPSLIQRILIPLTSFDAIAISGTAVWILQAKIFGSFCQPNVDLYLFDLNSPENFLFRKRGVLSVFEEKVRFIAQKNKVFIPAGDAGIMVFEKQLSSSTSNQWEEYK